MKMSATTTADTSDKWKFERAEYFVKEDENGLNQLLQWCNTKREDLQVNAYDSKNHESIFNLWPGSREIYKEFEEAMKKLVKETSERDELDELDKYRLLLWSVSVHKQMSKGDTKEVEACISPIKGNNRAGAHVHMILGAKYDAKEGLLECGTLKTDWIVEQMCVNPN